MEYALRPPSFSLPLHNIISIEAITALDFGWVRNWEHVWFPQYKTSSYTYATMHAQMKHIL